MIVGAALTGRLKEMAKETVKKKDKSGIRFKTLKETRRDAQKTRGALIRRVKKRIAKVWGL